MRLVSLQFIPRGIHGWESPELEFAQRTTSLFAKNGSGKTPLIQAIAFCLGFATTFREEIRERCSAVVLKVELNGKILEAQRELSAGEFHLTTRIDGETRDFFAEGEFSRLLFRSLGMAEPLLVDNKRGATKPYISTVLPIFYVKQDGGYLDAYRASANFIQDQFVEMVRFVFGMAPKRSYSASKDLLEAKQQLELLQRRIVAQQQGVVDLAARVDDSPAATEAMAARSDFLALQLNDLKASADSADAASDALKELLNAKDEKLRGLKRQRYELSTRVTGIDSIRSEIDGELQTLTLNEQSRRAFEIFGEICNKPDCGLFFVDSVSYAKNLLYLRDQIKDLEANAVRAEIQLEELDRRIDEDEQDRQLIVTKLEALPQNTATDKLIAAVQALTKELLEIEQQRASVNVLVELRRKFYQLEQEREKLQDRIASLSSNVRGELEFLQLRAKIRESLVKWMDILHTLNVSHEIDIDANFRFKFGTEPLDVFTGSTRSRLVLAIHAAMFEAYLEGKERHFRFLILDTPKQHELDGADLANYLKELQLVCDKYGGQIIISSTEYRHPIGANDREWLPEYPGTEQAMYLGKPGTNNEELA